MTLSDSAFLPAILPASCHSPSGEGKLWNESDLDPSGGQGVPTHTENQREIFKSFIISLIPFKICH